MASFRLMLYSKYRFNDFHMCMTYPPPIRKSVPDKLPCVMPVMVYGPFIISLGQYLTCICSLWMSAGTGIEVSSPNSCLCSDSNGLTSFMKWENPNPTAAPADQCSDIPYSIPKPAMPPARPHRSASAISLLPWHKAAAQALNMNIRHSNIRLIFFGKSMPLDQDDCAILKKILQIFLFFKIMNLL